MNSVDLDRINHLVVDLIVEFEKEAGKLRAEYDNSNMRIQEIDENIFNYKENEDVDIQVFSPRKVDNKNEVRLDSLNKEKDEVQSSVKDITKQMKYYNDKIDKLKEIRAILNNEETDDSGLSSNRGIERIFNIDEKIKNEEMSTVNETASEISDKRSKKSSSAEKEYTDFDSSSNANDILDILNDDNKKNKTDNSSLISSLTRISHKADVGHKIVDNDVFRAKMEFKSIKSNLEDVINSLKSH